ncbi:MAG: hypothetical protein KDA96_13990, partial [Planctomycetaceae bacterium]|nr:hypothetical protein [Planctomycetaceae bacterium]
IVTDEGASEASKEEAPTAAPASVDASSSQEEAAQESQESPAQDAADAAADATPADAATPEPAKPEGSGAPADEPSVDPAKAAEEAYQQAVAEFEQARATYEADLKAWNDRAASGKKKAEELTRRFASWYYIISADSFEKFRPARKDLVSLKTDEEEGEAPAPGFAPPSIPGFPQ